MKNGKRSEILLAEVEWILFNVETGLEALKDITNSVERVGRALRQARADLLHIRHHPKLKKGTAKKRREKHWSDDPKNQGIA